MTKKILALKTEYYVNFTYLLLVLLPLGHAVQHNIRHSQINFIVLNIIIIKYLMIHYFTIFKQYEEQKEKNNLNKILYKVL